METENDFNTDDYYNIDYYKSLKGKEAFNERVHKGRLPIIDIKGHPFFVNARIGLLQPKDNFHTIGINIRDIEMDDKTKQLFFYYHPPSMTRVRFPEDIKELPKDVVGVWVPNRYYLDPIGMARANDKEPRYYLGDGIPLRMYRTARIVPIENTPLAEIIKKNNEQQPLNKRVQPTKPTKKRKRGKGL